MCLIVVKNGDDAEFNMENFERSFNRNSDGMGIMWNDGGRIQVERVLGKLEQQRKVYRRHMNKDQFVLHHRFATHGAKTPAGLLANCHPYKIMDMDDGDPIDMYMAHNGVITSVETTDTDMSDTWNFVENHIKPILKADYNLLWSIGVQKMISNYIGNGNKLVILTNDTQGERSPLLIFNKSAGTEVNGCWLSNTYSTQAPVVYNNYNATQRPLFERRVSSAYDYDDSDWSDDYNQYGKYHHTIENGKHKRDGFLFNTFSEFKTYVDTLEHSSHLQVLNKELVVEKLPAVIDQNGNELFKKKDEVKSETNANMCQIASTTELEEWKKELRTAVLTGVMRLDEVVYDLTPEEYAELKEELVAEAGEDDYDTMASVLVAEVRTMYDPEHVDESQMKILVEHASKSFNTIEIELMIDHDPQVAADMLEYLLSVYECDKEAKAA